MKNQIKRKMSSRRSNGFFVGMSLMVFFGSRGHSDTEPYKVFRSTPYGYEFSYPSDYTLIDMSNRMPAGFWLSLGKASVGLRMQVEDFDQKDFKEKDFNSIAAHIAVQSLVSGCGETPETQTKTNMFVPGVTAVKVVVMISSCSDGPDTEYNSNLPKESQSVYVVNITGNAGGKALVIPRETMPEEIVEGIVRSIKFSPQ